MKLIFYVLIGLFFINTMISCSGSEVDCNQMYAENYNDAEAAKEAGLSQCQTYANALGDPEQAEAAYIQCFDAVMTQYNNGIEQASHDLECCKDPSKCGTAG